MEGLRGLVDRAVLGEPAAPDSTFLGRPEGHGRYRVLTPRQERAVTPHAVVQGLPLLKVTGDRATHLEAGVEV